MKGLRSAVLLLCVVLAFLADTAPAQTNTKAPSSRRYDSRIQMHAAPTTLQLPDNSFETQKGAPESTERDLMMQSDRPMGLDIPNDMPQESQIRPNGPRRRDSQEKQKSKSWLLPSSTKEEKNDEETTSNQQEEVAPSGWGWLADDVRARQLKQEEKDDRKKDDSEKQDNERQPQQAGQKESSGSKTDGIFLNTAFKPVSGSTPTKEKDTSVQDERQEDQKKRADGPTTVENPRSRTAADQPREQNFGADATWGNENLWSKNSKPVNTLPQTEALLSMSKPGAIKQVSGLDRPGFKPDEGRGIVNQVESDRLEPARRNFVSAASFQPLPAAPVSDLGNNPWDGGLSGKAPFGGSAPFSSEPSLAPSRPIESLKATELPKLASPWLR